MQIDDVTLANAIAARLPWREDDQLEEALFTYGLALRTFINTYAAGPYRPADEAVAKVRELFGRPAGEEWQMADWARRLQEAMDGVERRELPSWDPPPERGGFSTSGAPRGEG